MTVRDDAYLLVLEGGAAAEPRRRDPTGRPSGGSDQGTWTRGGQGRRWPGHPEHGPAFWRAVGKAMPDYEERRAALSEAGPRLVWRALRG